MNRGSNYFFKLLSTGLTVGVFTAIGVTLVSLVHQATAEQIFENQREAIRQAFNQVLESERYDNQPFNHPLELESAEWINGGEPITVYTAISKGQLIATLLSVEAQHGYNGKITLLVGILADGTLSGVEVVAHHETPGLGDKIESRRSPWLEQFHGRSLASPKQDDWGVKRDGGAFDQISGATVTSRAVIQSLKKALTYIQQQIPSRFNEESDQVMEMHDIRHAREVINEAGNQYRWESLPKHLVHSNRSLLI
ncbi:MAG: electron transport complex subunit RsxG [Candidatus Thiodiazotropha sp. L084R]